MALTTLGPYTGVYQPDFEVRFWRQGDPSKPITGFDRTSVTSIVTSKQLQDIAGTFTVTFKDPAARDKLAEMDVVRIRLSGHGPQGLTTVWKGVVDTVREAGQYDAYAGQDDIVVTGRCMGKYLMISYLFLPVWNPQANLPTALIFGRGDVTNKAGGNQKGGAGTPAAAGSSPYAIFNYLLRHYTFGVRGLVGQSGIANARHWIDARARFVHKAKAGGGNKFDFDVPFVQFDENNSVADALKTLEVLGFTEAWIDELGYVVYRHPGWDSPVAYSLHTGGLKTDHLQRSDEEVKTQIEVVPAGDPGIDTGTAQALRAGRAPVPSTYMQAATSGAAGLGAYTDPEFVIDTDSNGKVTRKGKRNYWYKRQLRLGVRVQQVVSPLIFDQRQAQKQAEGLLRFLSRLTKSGEIVIPGAPEVRLGHSIRVHGPLKAGNINRTYYIEGVKHELIVGERYDTTLTLTHGRDPWDPKWGSINIPRFDPAVLAKEPGIMDTGSKGSGTGGSGVPSADGFYVFPYPGISHQTRVDRGQDMESSKAHPPLLALGNARVVSAGRPFQVAWPEIVIELTDGPLKGQQVFYGHVNDCYVHGGQTVGRGATIGTGGGPSEGGSAGHIEIGFWPVEGSIASGTHYTKSGQRFHDFCHKNWPQFIPARTIIN